MSNNIAMLGILPTIQFVTFKVMSGSHNDFRKVKRMPKSDDPMYS